MPFLLRTNPALPPASTSLSLPPLPCSIPFHSPDFLGEEGHDVCILLNEAYAALMDPDTRAAYNVKLEQTLTDFEDDYTGMGCWARLMMGNPCANGYPATVCTTFATEDASHCIAATCHSHSSVELA